MGSYSLTILTLSASLTLTGKSLALKCYSCACKNHECIDEECKVDPLLVKMGLGSSIIHCFSYQNDRGENLGKGCTFGGEWKDLVGGNNHCKLYTPSKYREMDKTWNANQRAAIQSAVAAGKITPENVTDFFKRSVDKIMDIKKQQRDTKDQMLKICVCDSKDLCNSDEDIRKLPVAKDDASIQLKSGAHVEVFLLVVAAQVYGFC